ncbi:MAG: hypothetical protein RIR34_1088 [Actinomycetota bacterium]|jgi:hypothetical protein
MDFSKYQEARLIPVTGVKGDQDQERRATSAFLAVLVGVPELAKTLLKVAGAPAGKVKTYIEPEFEVGEKKIRPDGLISVERAGKQWVALVEVKTSKNLLNADQLNAYLEIARINKFDALITISNEVLTLSGQHPTEGIDARKLRSTTLTHFSWIRIITECLIQSEHRGVKDPDQAWILKELIRFLQADASGANEFDDMGQHWVPVREAIASGAIGTTDKRLGEIVHKYESLMRFVSFKLSARLGVQAREVAPRIAKDDPKKHLAQSTQNFVQTRTLVGKIAIPGTSSDIDVTADLRANQVLCQLQIDAPKDGRSLTRINWLLRQLPNAPKSSRVEVFVRNGRQAAAVALLSDALSDPKKLVPSEEREIVSFRVTTITKMGSKRGSGAGSFIQSVADAVENTYGEVLQNIRPWVSKPPTLSETVTELIPEPHDSSYEGQL